jgi:hypothetical protein
MKGAADKLAVRADYSKVRFQRIRLDFFVRSLIAVNAAKVLNPAVGICCN